MKTSLAILILSLSQAIGQLVNLNAKWAVY